MYKYYFCILVFLSIWVISCNSGHKELQFSPPQFLDTVDLRGRVIVDTFIMGAGFDIDFYHNYLILQAYRGPEEAKIHFFDLSDGSHVKSILPKGRGPGEAISVIDFDVDHDSGDVLFYDAMGYKLFRFNIDSVINHENHRDYISSEVYPVYMYAVYWGKDGYIAKGGNKSGDREAPRFSLINDDSLRFQYCTYPEVLVPGVPEGINIAYSSYSHVGISPDKNKLVCLSSLGAILEIFDLKKDEIVLDTIRGFYRPVFEIEKNENVVYIPGQTIRGFSDLYVTHKYIYAQFDSEPDYKNRKNIAVFDWMGNCIRLYCTDYDLIRICVDEDRNKLYAFCRNEKFEYVLVEFSLD